MYIVHIKVCSPEVNQQSKEDLASNLYCFAFWSVINKEHSSSVKCWVPAPTPNVQVFPFQKLTSPLDGAHHSEF